SVPMLPAEEKKIIEKRDHYRDFYREGIDHQGVEKPGPGESGQPFYFYRQDKKEEELKIRVDRREGEKNGRVKIKGPVPASEEKSGRGRAGGARQIKKRER